MKLKENKSRIGPQLSISIYRRQNLIKNTSIEPQPTTHNSNPNSIAPLDVTRGNRKLNLIVFAEIWNGGINFRDIQCFSVILIDWLLVLIDLRTVRQDGFKVVLSVADGGISYKISLFFSEENDCQNSNWWEMLVYLHSLVCSLFSHLLSLDLYSIRCVW